MKSEGLFHPTSSSFSPTTARLVSSKTVGGIHFPSDAVKSFTNISETVLSPGGPRYGRPSDRFGPLTALFDQALARLKYDLEHLEAFTPISSGIGSAFELVTTATAFFELEDERELTLGRPMARLIKGRPQWQDSLPEEAAGAGAVFLEGCFTYLILELKNESGLGGIQLVPVQQSSVVPFALAFHLWSVHDGFNSDPKHAVPPTRRGR